MAEVALSRPAPDPERALGRLERIRPDSPSLAAWVLTDKGKAHDLLGRDDRSEACWSEALRLDPSAAEAGRRLLDLYTNLGRLAEARELGLRQVVRETDPRALVQSLARLARLEVAPPEPWTIVNRSDSRVRRGAADLATTIAYGLALASVSRGDEARRILRQSLERYPDDPRAWDGLMTALEISHQESELAEVFGALPRAMSEDPRFAKHRGWVEQRAGRWAVAAEAYRRAWDFEPDNVVGYRLRRMLRFAGQSQEAERYDRIVLGYREAFKQVRAALDEAEAWLEKGDAAPLEFCGRLAALRERMGRSDEARAWRRAIALARMSGPPGSPHPVRP
jgi:tetratricopeptide (TPR) repeat protein